MYWYTASKKAGKSSMLRSSGMLAALVVPKRQAQAEAPVAAGPDHHGASHNLVEAQACVHEVTLQGGPAVGVRGEGGERGDWEHATDEALAAEGYFGRLGQADARTGRPYRGLGQALGLGTATRVPVAETAGVAVESQRGHRCPGPGRPGPPPPLESHQDVIVVVGSAQHDCEPTGEASGYAPLQPAMLGPVAAQLRKAS